MQFEQLKDSYTTLRGRWSIDKLISVCVQEEDRLNRKRAERAHLTMVAPSKKRK